MADATPHARAPRERRAYWCWPTARVIWGRGFGADGRGGRRGLLQHRDDRLSGDHDRSLLCRRRSSPSPSRISAMSAPMPRMWRRTIRWRARLRRARGRDRARAISARRRASATGCARNGRIGLSGVDTRALTRRSASTARPTRSSRMIPTGKFDIRRRCSKARAAGRGSRAWTSPRTCPAGRCYRWDGRPLGARRGLCRARADDETLPARRRDRLRRQAQHLPQPGRGRRAGDGAARRPRLRRGDGARARRRVPLQRPRRSGGDRRICGAGDPGRCWRPASRSSASASATRCSASPSGAHDHQDAPGPSRRQPPGQAPRRRPVEITSMNHGFAVETRQPAGQRVEATHVSPVRRRRTAALRSRTSRRSACSITPRRARGRRTATICSRSSWGCWSERASTDSACADCIAVRLRSAAQR